MWDVGNFDSHVAQPCLCCMMMLLWLLQEASSKKGVLYAFIVLDNPASSLLDMQTVSFANGKPVFNKYIDSFPFHFYVVLRHIAALPHTLADLLRQWFELGAS